MMNGRTSLIVGGEPSAELRASLDERCGVVRTACGASSPEELSSAVVDTAEETGGIDELVFVWRAGADGERLALDLEAADWDDAMERGPRAFFLACKYAVPYLVSRPGSRVTLAMPRVDAPMDAASAASRAALEETASRLSCELAPFGVSVETVTGA